MPLTIYTEPIFPVFAGMIPVQEWYNQAEADFPRIRGDDPVPLDGDTATKLFSPYSRG